MDVVFVFVALLVACSSSSCGLLLGFRVLSVWCFGLPSRGLGSRSKAFGAMVQGLRLRV